MIVATALWLGGYLLCTLGYWCLGIFAGSLVALWAMVGLVEMNLATVAGAWIYRE